MTSCAEFKLINVIKRYTSTSLEKALPTWYEAERSPLLFKQVLMLATGNLSTQRELFLQSGVRIGRLKEHPWV